MTNKMSTYPRVPSCNRLYSITRRGDTSSDGGQSIDDIPVDYLQSVQRRFRRCGYMPPSFARAMRRLHLSKALSAIDLAIAIEYADSNIAEGILI